MHAAAFYLCLVHFALLFYSTEAENTVLVDASNLEYYNAYNQAVALQYADPDGAIELYKHAISGKPDLFQAHQNLAILYDSRGDVELALTHHRLACDLADSDSFRASCFNNIATLQLGMLSTRNLKGLAPILDTLDLAYDSDPTCTGALLTNAFAYISIGHHSEAILPLLRVVELDPSNVLATLNIGNHFFYQRNYNVAILFYLKVLHHIDDAMNETSGTDSVCVEDGVAMQILLVLNNLGQSYRELQLLWQAHRVFTYAVHKFGLVRKLCSGYEAVQGEYVSWWLRGRQSQRLRYLDFLVASEHGADGHPAVAKESFQLSQMDDIRVWSLINLFAIQTIGCSWEHMELREVLMLAALPVCVNEFSRPRKIRNDDICAAYQSFTSKAAPESIFDPYTYGLLRFSPQPLVATRKDDGSSFAEGAASVCLSKEVCKLCVADPLPLSDNGTSRKEFRRLRIGYLSYDWRDHPMGRLTHFLVTGHSNEAAAEQYNSISHEVFLLSYGPNDGSPIREYIEGWPTTTFIDLHSINSDRDAATVVSRLELDILVDLTTHTYNGRADIAGLRPAPITINYLGYPGTTGCQAFDYAMVDSRVAPPELNKLFTERLLYLPYNYQSTSMPMAVELCLSPHGGARRYLLSNHRAAGCRNRLFKSAVAEVVVVDTQPLSADWESRIAGAGPLLCSFNAAKKFEPISFSVWCNVLRRMPTAMLLLLDIEDSSFSHPNLLNQFRFHGISPKRVLFLNKKSWEEHLYRAAACDVVIDNFVYGSHTTGSDMLWVGVPVVALESWGDGRMPSRVASAITKALFLPAGSQGGVKEEANVHNLVVVQDVKQYEDTITRLSSEHFELMHRELLSRSLKRSGFDKHMMQWSVERAYQAVTEVSGFDRRYHVLASPSQHLQASGGAQGPRTMCDDALKTLLQLGDDISIPQDSSVLDVLRRAYADRVHENHPFQPKALPVIAVWCRSVINNCNFVDQIMTEFTGEPGWFVEMCNFELNESPILPRKSRIQAKSLTDSVVQTYRSANSDTQDESMIHKIFTIGTAGDVMIGKITGRKYANEDASTFGGCPHITSELILLLYSYEDSVFLLESELQAFKLTPVDPPRNVGQMRIDLVKFAIDLLQRALLRAIATERCDVYEVLTDLIHSIVDAQNTFIENQKPLGAQGEAAIRHQGGPLLAIELFRDFQRLFFVEYDGWPNFKYITRRLNTPPPFPEAAFWFNGTEELLTSTGSPFARGKSFPLSLLSPLVQAVTSDQVLVSVVQDLSMFLNNQAVSMSGQDKPLLAASLMLSSYITDPKPIRLRYLGLLIQQDLATDSDALHDVFAELGFEIASTSIMQQHIIEFEAAMAGGGVYTPVFSHDKSHSVNKPLRIVFYCEEYGNAWWPQWGPSSVKPSIGGKIQGAGGSEEAVIYISKELAKLGHYVEVYADPSPEDHCRPLPLSDSKENLCSCEHTDNVCYFHHREWDVMGRKPLEEIHIMEMRGDEVYERGSTAPASAEPHITRSLKTLEDDVQYSQDGMFTTEVKRLVVSHVEREVVDGVHFVAWRYPLSLLLGKRRSSKFATQTTTITTTETTSTPFDVAEASVSSFHEQSMTARSTSDAVYLWAHDLLPHVALPRSLVPAGDVSSRSGAHISKLFCQSIYHKVQLPHYMEDIIEPLRNGISPGMIREIQKETAKHASLPDSTDRQSPEATINNQLNIISGATDYSRAVRRRVKFVYGSAPNRGLEYVLKIWNFVRKCVPEAELHVYYGFGKVLDKKMKQLAQNRGRNASEDQPPQLFDSWKEQMMKLLLSNDSGGVHYHGSVDHITLGRGYYDGGFLLYPTRFSETGCITCIKAMVAGCIPISSGYKQSVLGDYSEECAYYSGDESVAPPRRRLNYSEVLRTCGSFDYESYRCRNSESDQAFQPKKVSVCEVSAGLHQPFDLGPELAWNDEYEALTELEFQQKLFSAQLAEYMGIGDAAGTVRADDVVGPGANRVDSALFRSVMDELMGLSEFRELMQDCLADFYSAVGEAPVSSKGTLLSRFDKWLYLHYLPSVVHAAKVVPTNELTAHRHRMMEEVFHSYNWKASAASLVDLLSAEAIS